MIMSTSKWWRQKWLIGAVLVLTAILLFYDLGRHSLSIDEYINVEIDRGSWGTILLLLQQGIDRHPPLTHFVMSVWLDIVPETDLTVRLPWALVGLLNVYLVYRLGCAWGDWRLGITGALLLATAPTFILYMRFEKYYALTMMFGLLLILSGLRFAGAPSLRTGLLYGIVLILLLYTDYFAPLFLVASQNLVLLFAKEWRRFRSFLAVQCVAGITFVPWLLQTSAQAGPLIASAESELSGFSVASVLIKLGYLFSSFSIGETLFPWKPLALVGLCGAIVACVLGVVLLWRRRADQRPSAFATLLIIIVVSGVGGALLTSLLFPVLPFITLPNHILFALPFAMLLLAAGIIKPTRRAWNTLLLIMLLVPRGLGIVNYFNGQQFHNPIYAVPMREVVQEIVAASQPGDIVLSDSDTGFAFYYQRGPQPIPLSSDTRFATAREFIEQQQPRRIWLLTFGRDRSRGQIPHDLTDWLNEHFTLIHEQGYVEQDPEYQYIKARLLNREVYKYKLLVQLYAAP